VAKALISTPINSHSLKCTEAIDSPYRDHWKRPIHKVSRLILLITKCTTTNSRQATQLQVQQIGSEEVSKTKHNLNATTRYKVSVVITVYKQTDFWAQYARDWKLNTFQYFMSLVRMNGWNINYLDIATAFLNPEVDENDIFMTILEGCPNGLNAPAIIVWLQKALVGLKQGPRL